MKSINTLKMRFYDTGGIKVNITNKRLHDFFHVTALKFNFKRPYQPEQPLNC